MTKHFFKSIAALVMCLPMFMTSCSKDNDNSTTPTNNVDIVSINTAAFYDKLGITDVIAETLTQGLIKEGGWQIFYQPTDPEDLPLIIPVN